MNQQQDTKSNQARLENGIKKAQEVGQRYKNRPKMHSN